MQLYFIRLSLILNWPKNYLPTCQLDHTHLSPSRTFSLLLTHTHTTPSLPLSHTPLSLSLLLTHTHTHALINLRQNNYEFSFWFLSSTFYWVHRTGDLFCPLCHLPPILIFCPRFEGRQRTRRLLNWSIVKLVNAGRKSCSGSFFNRT